MRARDCVRRGIKILDQAKPGWWRKIKVTQLKLASCQLCVLGQLYANGGGSGYSKGRMELGRLADEGKLKLPRGYNGSAIRGGGSAFGFDVRDDITYEQLDRLWAEEIRARRANARTLKAA